MTTAQEADMSHGRIVIDPERCKGCALCTTVCPQGVIHMADTFNALGYRPARLVDPGGACTGCAVCALICPDVAITVYRQLSPRDRAASLR
jgi:2-oxoglutarate ferredoxin oxidoreductase subunit delta